MASCHPAGSGYIYAGFLHRRAIVENFESPSAYAPPVKAVCAILTDMQGSVVDLQIELSRDFRHCIAGVNCGQFFSASSQLHGRKKLWRCQRKQQQSDPQPRLALRRF